MSIITKLQIKIKAVANRLEIFKNCRRLARKLAVELTRLEGQLEKLLAAIRKPADKLVFSSVNVARVLGISKELIADVWQSGKDAIAKLIDGSELPIKKYDALVAMSQIRKERSRSLKVTQHLTNANGFTVRNETKDSYYCLELSDKSLTCECQDYQNLKAELGDKVCCKHGYAVLSLLGHSTLKDCLSKMKDLQPEAIETPIRYIPRSDDAYSITSYEARMDY